MAMSDGANTGTNTKRPWLAPAWKPGQSGNPNGRPKSKVLRALLEPHRRVMVAKLLVIMRSGKDREALEAIKVMLSYTDGPPNSPAPDDMTDEQLLEVVLRRRDAAPA